MNAKHFENILYITPYVTLTYVATCRICQELVSFQSPLHTSDAAPSTLASSLLCLS